MGNLFSSIGLDSIACVDNSVTCLLFQPPNTKKETITNLKNLQNTKLFTLNSDTGNDISVIEIDKNKNNKVLIFSHGNGCDIYTCYSMLNEYAEKFGVKVVCYDYPGYGLSTGKSSEENCYDAINCVIKHYEKSIDKKNIILVGQSLGTGVTVNYALDNKWLSPIILISPYKSIGRVICDSSITESSFKHNMFKSYVKVEKLDCPVRIIHGYNDNLIPISHGQYLYSKLKNPLKPSWKFGCGHNNIYLEHDDMIDIL